MSQPNTVPVYRFWSDSFGGHFFTADENEKAEFDANPDWHGEGIAYYAYPNVEQ